MTRPRKQLTKINTAAWSFGLIGGIFITLVGSHSNSTESKVDVKIEIKDIPKEIIRVCNDSKGQIAEIGGAFNHSDVVNSNTPRARLVVVCKGDNRWEVVCEFGGYSLRTKNFIFTRKNKNSKWSQASSNDVNTGYKPRCE